MSDEPNAAALRALAGRVPADGPAVVIMARQRAMDAAWAVVTAIGADPTLAERRQRDIDVLAEVLRRLTPLARQAAREIERERTAAAGVDTAHFGRTNPMAPEELDALSGRCTVLAAAITAAVLPDWDSPQRIRELSASRMPHALELADVADMLHRLVASALDLSCPDPEAVRLAALAEQIRQRPAEPAVVTEYSTACKGGDHVVWDTAPYIEAVYPLAKRIDDWRRHQGGQVYRRRVIVVEDWAEVDEP